MAIEANKETLVLSQIVGHKVDTFFAETDSVVPDIKPDILNTISTNGTVCVYKKEVLEGKVKVEGSIQVYVMYMADNESSEIRSLTTNIDFSKTIEMDHCKEGMLLDEQIHLKSIECRVLNGRKINLKAMLEMELSVSSNEEMQFIKEVKEVTDIQLLNESLKLNSLLGTGTTKVYAKDTFVIDGVDDLAEIMKVTIATRNKETKVSYNKVLAKADAEVKILYLTTDGRIGMVRNLIPVMGFIDMPNVAEDNLCETNYEVRNVIIKPNSVEEHSIYVEVELELNCNVFETKNINMIQDLYSPTRNLCYEQKKINGRGQKTVVKDCCKIYENQFIEEIGNRRLYDVDVIPTIINQTIRNDNILYEGEVELRFFFEADNSTKIDTKTMVLPFNYNMETIGIDQNFEVSTGMEVTMQDFVITPEQSIDMKIEIEFTTTMAQKQTVQVIHEIREEENREEEKYSLVIYFVKPGDTLWKIAKMFKSTVEAITKVNEIERPDILRVGEKLYIPMAI